MSVLDFEKQERQKEVAELEQTISGSKEELGDILHQQIAAGQGAGAVDSGTVKGIGTGRKGKQTLETCL